VAAVMLREPVALDVIRDRKSLYQLRDDGYVDNVYTIRILNKSERAQRFSLTAHGASPLTLLPAAREYSVPSGEVYSIPVRVRRATYEPVGAETITFELGSLDDADVHTQTRARFLAPTR
jgi:polyferredoxin